MLHVEAKQMFSTNAFYKPQNWRKRVEMQCNIIYCVMYKWCEILNKTENKTKFEHNHCIFVNLSSLEDFLPIEESTGWASRMLDCWIFYGILLKAFHSMFAAVRVLCVIRMEWQLRSECSCGAIYCFAFVCANRLVIFVCCDSSWLAVRHWYGVWYNIALVIT